MGSRRDPGFGLLLIDTRLSPDSEVAQGATSVDSAYTQANPQPGTPVPGYASSSWRPQISGYQDRSVDAIALRGGYPGQDRTGRPAASVAVRVTAASPSEDDYLGWDEPVTHRRWTSAPNIFGAAAGAAAVAVCVIPSTQEIVLYTCGAAGGSRVLSTYDPRRETWAEIVTPIAIVVPTPVALAYDEERETMILFGGYDAAYGDSTIALYSRDKGTTWAPYSRGLYNTVTYAGRVTVATQSRRPWVMLRAGSGSYGQYTSTDHGASWVQVETAASVVSGSEARVVALKSGGYLVVYVADTSLDLTCRRLGTSSTALSQAAAVSISTANTLDVVAAVDADGIVYVYQQLAGGGGDIAVWRSLDEGTTWEQYDFLAHSPWATTDYPTFDHAIAAAGMIGVVHGMTGHADLATSKGLMLFGGWTSVEAGTAATGLHVRTERLGYGSYDFGFATIPLGYSWYPVDIPVTSWTAAGGGTVSWVATDGCGLRIATIAAAKNYTASNTGAAARIATIEIELSPLTGDTSTGASARVVLTDGATYRYEAEFYLSATAIRITDPNGALDTTVSSITTMDTTGVRIRAILTQDTAGNSFVSAAYRTIGTDRWTILANQETIAAGTPVAGADSLCWGHIGTGSATSVWRFAGIAFGVDWLWGLDDGADYRDTPYDEGHLGLRWGRALPGSASGGYPCPAASVVTYASGSPTVCPRISATGGPAQIVETTSLPTGYGRSIRSIYPTLSPSPSRYWESTDTTAHRIVWDLGEAAWLGDALGLVVIGSYGRQVSLEYWTGASWTVAGTLDLSLSAGTALNCTRAGSAITPRAATTEIARYLDEGSLVGGYAILSAGAGFAARRIVRQSAGYWSESAHQPVRITLEGVDGTEDTAGTVDLIAPGGVLVAYPTAVQARQLWRVVWAASQVTPGSVYRAGVVGVGRVVGVGADPGWDWSRSMQLSREVTRDRTGSIRQVRQVQSPRETLSYSWAEGLDLYTLRSSRTPDYVATSTGLAIGSKEDATSLLGHVEHAMASGEVPCVVLPRLPSTTGTILDPTLWVYGILSSESVGVSGVVGTEGTDEVIRLTGAAFERIR